MWSAHAQKLALSEGKTASYRQLRSTEACELGLQLSCSNKNIKHGSEHERL